MRRSRWVITLFGLVTLAGCDRSSEPSESAGVRSSGTKPTAAAPHAAAPQQAGAQAAGDLSFEAPAGWTLSDKPMPMRKATYVVPRAPGDAEDGDLSVSQAGGSVPQNVARWAGQFGVKPEDAKQSSKTVAGLKVTMVEIHGEYAGMAMGGAGAGKKPGWGLLGAIIETSPPHFLKLTGPDKTLAAAKKDFDRFVESAKAK